MSRLSYIFGMMFYGLLMNGNAQPLKQYSVVSLMNGQSQFISDTGSVITLPIWGYAVNEGITVLRIPGPTIYANQGDSVHIAMANPSMEGHTIHLHGLDVDEANDGVPHHTGFIQQNESFTYRFKATHAGNYLYHCHVTTTMHLTLGMYGMVIVYPTDSSNRIYDSGPVYDRQYEFLMSEMDSRWNSDYTSIGSFLTFDPDLFLLNGKNRSLIYNDTNMVLNGTIGDYLLMRMLNVGYRVNRLIFPNTVQAQVHTSDGRVLSEPFIADTLLVYPGERYSIMIEVLDDAPSFVAVDYLDPYRLKFLGREYIPINDNSFEYFAPNIVDNDTDTIGVGAAQVNGNQVMVFPNPAENQLHLISSTGGFKGCTISDIQGRVVLYQELNLQNEVVDLQTLQSGSYVLVIQMKNGESVRKKIIKN